ncbi:MAG: thioredoxin-like domain-containing protein [Gemmataceae bacterium]|nr:thioredoxin-like domain-containing protein [Gemmataceae bacterium]MDW8263706.1 thioredoxin-like domain-containing protein [Gemmataceae bacterium]
MTSIPPGSQAGMRSRRWLLLGGLPVATVLVVLAAFDRWWTRMPASQALAQEGARVKAPELDGGVAWLNCAGPIRLRDLRGKIVVLDFWTLCCINCIHTLPDLAKLEKKYPNELVVIGVHSAKFDNEKNSESIRKAILRYEISHPVVNDANMRIWQAYDVRAWPTLYVIDPEGYIVGRGSGEGLYEALDEVIAKLIKEHRKKKTLNDQPLHFDLARFKERGDGPLFFPGKVLADAEGNRLFIADSTHHRIVITDLQGNKLAIAGSGEPGHADGPFAKAMFNDPQGLALRGDTLYVADRKNHLIRALNLQNQTVITVAGTGSQGHDRGSGGPALQTGLNSPWDLFLKGDTLYIAMAGHHQIWTLDLAKKQLAPYAGNGREDIVDGPVGLPSRACFAQPSGLASDGKTLFVADSEVSAIRAVPLDGKGEVSTIVGQGLFEFGDIDGVGDKVRLQHALGVLVLDGKLYVADTYNSKLKVIDPAKRSCTTFLGGKDANGEPLFNEPAGLSHAQGKLYVADTNAHRIRVVDLKTKAVTTLPLRGVEPPKRAAEDERPIFPNPRRTTLAAATLPPHGDLALNVALRVARGFKLNPAAPMRCLIESLSSGKVTWSEARTLNDRSPPFVVSVPLAKLASSDLLRLSLVYYECSEGSEGVCRIKSHIWEVPLKFDPTSSVRSLELRALAGNTDDKKN